jgi:heme-degrading monooxygenase HmoA
MIARIWRGAVRPDDTDMYLDYLHETGLSAYAGTPGNLGVLALRRRLADKTEFFLVTLWESEKSIEQFAGKDIGKAVFYPEDERFLVDRNEHVDHFDVVYRSGSLDR